MDIKYYTVDNEHIDGEELARYYGEAIVNGRINPSITSYEKFVKDVDSGTMTWYDNTKNKHMSIRPVDKKKLPVFTVRYEQKLSGILKISAPNYEMAVNEADAKVCDGSYDLDFDDDNYEVVCSECLKPISKGNIYVKGNDCVCEECSKAKKVD